MFTVLMGFSYSKFKSVLGSNFNMTWFYSGEMMSFQNFMFY